MRHRLVAALAFLTIGACAMGPKQLADIGRYDRADITLKTGRTLPLLAPREFGDAYCGVEFCVRKADVRSIRGYRDPGVLTRIFGGTMQAAWCAGDRSVSVSCPNPGPYAELEGPPATQAQKSRQWLDNLSIRTGMVVGGSTQNMCAGAGPDSIEKRFATDAEALAWLAAQPNGVTPACLMSAAEFLAQQGDHVRARRLWALSSIRVNWARNNCADSLSPLRPLRGTWRITPPTLLDSGGHGDPATIATIIAVIADDETYSATQADIALLCQQGPVAPAPDRAAFAKAAMPFLDETGK